MTVSKKDFVAIAAILKQANKDSSVSVNWIAGELAAYFKAQNPRFDSDRFLEACEFSSRQALKEASL